MSPAGDETPEAPSRPAEESALVLPRGCFGPAFFLHQLGAFVRDRCPAASERLPVVEIHLATGEVLDLCHVVGVAPGFVALAVRVPPRSGTVEAMVTELVPFEQVARVSIGPPREDDARVGFDTRHVPSDLGAGAGIPAGSSAEDVLAAAAGEGPSGPGETSQAALPRPDSAWHRAPRVVLGESPRRRSR